MAAWASSRYGSSRARRASGRPARGLLASSAMNRTYLAAIAVVGLTATACSSESETETCPAEVGVQVECLVQLAERLDQSLQPKVSAAISACASIVADLGGTVPTYDESVVTPEDLDAVCNAATEEIQAAIAASSAGVTATSGDCTVDDAALQACEQSNVEAACAAGCSTQVYLEAQCTSSSVTVDPPNTALASTLEDNFPALLDLAVYLEDVAAPISTLAAEAVSSVADGMATNASCESQHGEDVSRAVELLGEWTSGVSALVDTTTTVLGSTA